MFHSFIHYFKKEAATLIHQHANDRVTRFFEASEIAAAKENILLEVSQLNTEFDLLRHVTPGRAVFYDEAKQRYYLPFKHRTYLTAREMDCLCWFNLGKTAAETAIILIRTYEKLQLIVNRSQGYWLKDQGVALSDVVDYSHYYNRRVEATWDVHRKDLVGHRTASIYSAPKAIIH